MQLDNIQGQGIGAVRGAGGKDAMLFAIVRRGSRETASIRQMQPEDNEEVRALLDVLECGSKLRKTSISHRLRGEPSLAGYVLPPGVGRVDDSDGFKDHRTYFFRQYHHRHYISVIISVYSVQIRYYYIWYLSLSFKTLSHEFRKN
ncbi:MAG: hypothetical protein MZU95_05130 [Desulfomicrobium escambiense]|nr:hypothetical protein [Desulfomicrobium escambiense]